MIKIVQKDNLCYSVSPFCYYAIQYHLYDTECEKWRLKFIAKTVVSTQIGCFLLSDAVCHVTLGECFLLYSLASGDTEVTLVLVLSSYTSII